MPIKGLDTINRLTGGGYLRIGEKVPSKSGKGERPVSLDYIKFDPEDKRLLPIFEEHYGKKPTTIPVVLPSDDSEVVFPYYNTLFVKSGVLCQGDGEKATRYSDDGSSSCVSCCEKTQDCKFAMDKGSYGKPACAPTGTLTFLLPKLGVLQPFKFRTRSVNGIIAMNSALEMLRAVRGSIAGQEVNLVLRTKTTYRFDKGNKIPTEVNYVDIVIPTLATGIVPSAQPVEEAPVVKEALAVEEAPVVEAVEAKPSVEQAKAAPTWDEDRVVDAAKVMGVPQTKLTAILKSADRHGWDDRMIINTLINGLDKTDQAKYEYLLKDDPVPMMKPEPIPEPMLHPPEPTLEPAAEPEPVAAAPDAEDATPDTEDATPDAEDEDYGDLF